MSIYAVCRAFSFGLLLVLGAGVAAPFCSAATDKSRATAPVVVELFSSQGCSACIPALEALVELARDPRVIAVTFPVDYWNYLGWKDTLAQPAFSARQRSYAAARGERHVYTPQIVVNGALVPAKSEIAPITLAVEEARHSAPLRTEVRVQEHGGEVVIDVGDGEGSGHVWLLAVQRHQEVPITRGENEGRTLVFTNVVTSSRQVGVWTGSATVLRVNLPAGPRDNASGYVVLVQQARTSKGLGPMIGAAKGPGM
jgi:hypothetical protein